MSPDANQILLHTEDALSPPEKVKSDALISPEKYQEMYARSIENPEEFWADIAEQELEWFEKWDKVLDWNYPNYKWFVNGKINITYNCLDRHVNNGKGDQVAFIYTNEQREEQKITYAELLEKVCKCANGLKELGIEKGDRVAIYMPLTLEQIIAMLAIARVGAIHSVVFAGFSANALRVRIEAAECKFVMASTWTHRRGKKAPLKQVVDEAVEGLDYVKNVVVDRRGDDIDLSGKEVDFHELMNRQSADCPAERTDSEDPFFILYTSGTTGSPKGVVHTHGGYNLFTHCTTKWTFDYQDGDVFWCTADTGWITGHSYIVYGPLSVGCTSLIVEGAPDYPDPGTWWELVEKYKVNQFYTAPTAVRLFMKHGDKWPAKYDLSSLKVLGSVGEPINPEAWHWYDKHIGRGQASIVDTWWQTETGGHMLVSLPSMKQVPGKAGLPFFGIQAKVIDQDGNDVEPNRVGYLVISHPWPSALRTCWNDQERFEKYWKEKEGYYYPGDFATIDEHGYIMILGRADDVLNVSGHRIGTAEVEGALVEHDAVVEAAVIGIPDEVKGETIKAFCTLGDGKSPSDELVKEIKQVVRKELGGIAVPSSIDFVDNLPKTRSGKIMRRVLKAKELGQDVGDTSTLAD